MTTTAPNVAPAPGTALPCPSPWHDECEEIPAITIHHGDNYAFVGCSCFINGPLRGTEADAIAAWNQRTPDPALAAENARLIAENAALRDELNWLAHFATVRSLDESKVFARVNRGALRNIATRAGEMVGLTLDDMVEAVKPAKAGVS